MTITRPDVQPLYGRSVSDDRLRKWFLDGDVPVAVYGLGKMGLPLAAVYAETSGNVVGVDIDEDVVQRINRGECTVENEPRLPYLVSETVETGAFRATSDPEEAAENATVHVVIVPTTLDDEDPDLAALEAATRSIGSGLSKGDTVVIESTVPPGTCRDVVTPLLEEVSGLSLGDFGVAFCPERTSSGRAIRDIRASYPKVVGGVDEESTRVAEVIYGEITENDVVTTADATTAECVKVFEGLYRDVNIALANELARLGDELGVDVNEAIDVANTQPFCDIHDPGAGVGGHCIPYYPYFVIDEYGVETPVLRTSREVNESMPRYTAEKLLEGLAYAGIELDDATVALLGVTYRPGVRETRATPAVPIARRLAEAGVTVHAVDPVLEDPADVDGFPDGVQSAAIEGLRERDLDGAVLVTAHDEFDGIDWDAHDDLVVVDGRDALDLEASEHAVYTIGEG